MDWILVTKKNSIFNLSIDFDSIIKNISIEKINKDSSRLIDNSNIYVNDIKINNLNNLENITNEKNYLAIVYLLSPNVTSLLLNKICCYFNKKNYILSSIKIDKFTNINKIVFDIRTIENKILIKHYSKNKLEIISVDKCKNISSTYFNYILYELDLSNMKINAIVNYFV